MRTRPRFLAALLVLQGLLPVPLSAHQGGTHPTGLDECSDIAYATEWFHLFGDGVKSTSPQNPLDPQEYHVGNDAPDGQMPKATVKIAWALGQGHITTYDDFIVTVTIGGSRSYIGAGNTIGTSYIINPLIDGWLGTMTVHVQHKTCAFSMHATAFWAFEDPRATRCSKCANLTCDGRGEIKSIDIGVPIGSVRFGDQQVQLGYESQQVANEGIAKLAVLGPVGPNDAIVHKTDGLITSVECGDHLARVLPDPGPDDPARFRITVSSDKTDPLNTIYREALLHSTAGPDPVFRYEDTVAGRTTVREFAKPGPHTWTLTENGLRRTTKEQLSATTTQRTHRFTTEERNAGGAWVVVEQRDETETKLDWGWILTASVIDPLGEALTTTWDYYEAGEQSGPNGDVRGLGQLQSVTFPTGQVRRHLYYDTDPLDPAFTQLEITTEAYAGNPTGRETRLHSKFTGTFLTQRSETFLNGILVNRVDTTARSDGGGNYRVETRYPSDGGTPQVTRLDIDANPNTPLFAKTTHPDGTVEITNEIFSPGQKTMATFRGTFNQFSSTLPLFTGTIERTVVSKTGQVLQTNTSQVLGGVEFPVVERLASQLDALERPLAYDVFYGNRPTAGHTESLTYGCCGISSTTGADGITTFHYFDGLGRPVKTHANGLATETIHDGLTTRLHSYPEPFPSSLSLATPATESGFLTVNLAGHTVAQGSRSPQDNSLVTTTTSTTYAPAPGLGMRTVQTAPQTPDDQGLAPSVTQDFYLDGLPAATRGPLVAARQTTYGATPAGPTRTEARLDAAGNPFEPVTTQLDWLGRAISLTYAGDADHNSQPDQFLTTYDTGGRPVRTVDPDGVTTLFSYDLTTETVTTALDLNRDDVITTGADEIHTTRRGQFLNPQGALILWSENLVRDDAGQQRVLERSETRDDGLESWNYTYNAGVPALTHTLTTRLPATPGAWDTRTEFPDGTASIQRFRGALPETDESLDTNDLTLRIRQFSHDSRQRITSITDSAGPDLQTTYASPHLDLTALQTLGGLSTAFTYDHRGRATVVDAPDSLDATGTPVENRRTTAFYPHGGVREVSGTPGYQLSYTYDDALRPATLTTYGATPAVTRWIYSPDRGWLTAKLHDSPSPGQGSGPGYTHTAAGRTASRLSERGITTTYSYDNGGRLSLTSYSDGTPPVSILQRDRRGRVLRLSDAGGPRTLAYNDDDTLTSTTYDSGHLLAGWSVPQTHNAFGRLTALTLRKGGIDQHHIDYAYDDAGRLESVEANNLTAYYHYDSTTLRVAQLSVVNTQKALLFSTRSYDSLNRLSRINYHNGDVHGDFALHADHQLERDPYGRITRLTQTDRTQWRFGYNPAGELTTAARHLADTSSEPVRAHSFTWTYDGLGNRTSSSRSSGTTPAPAAYTPNALNQYISQTTPGRAEIFGEAPLATEVLVNGSPATRQGPFFHRTLTPDNTNSPVWQPVTVQNGSDTHTGHLPIPPATVAPTHDPDGNLLTNGLWQFTWDAENRLTAAESSPAATAAGLPYARLTYLYDADSRLLQRQRFDAPAASLPVETTRYLHAAWRRLGELNSTNQLTRTLTWGLDNSDTLHLGDPNAALLWIHDHNSSQSHLTHYDHNGNLTGLLSAQTKQATATYQYSPFGQLLAATGPYAKQNPYRFSTQAQDPDTGLLYYGYRHLDPETGRWLSRDPLGEAGGENLYGFVGNDATNNTDVLGLFKTTDDPRNAALVQEFMYGPAKVAATGAVTTAIDAMAVDAADQIGENLGTRSILKDFDCPDFLRELYPTDQYDWSRTFRAGRNGAITGAIAGPLLGKAAGPVLRIGGAAFRGMATRATRLRAVLTNRTPKSLAANNVVRLRQFGDEFQSILSQVRTGDFGTRRSGAVFWSGFRQGNQTAAMAWARANGKQTIEMTQGGKWLEGLDLYGPNSNLTSLEADHIWRAASAQFARGASGKVSAFTRSTYIDLSKIFYGLELRLLKSNPRVSSGIIYRGY